MRLGEIVTEAPAGVGYRGKVAAINQRAAAKKAAIDYNSPAVKKKLAAQNYNKWIAHVKKRRTQIDMSKPETYKAELLKFFSNGGKVNLGAEFKQKIATSKLSAKELKGLVTLAISARAAAKVVQPAAEPSGPAPNADGQGNMDLRGGSGGTPPRTQAVADPVGAEPADTQGSFDFDSKPAAEPVAPQPRAAPASKAKAKTVKVAGEPWTWDGEKWRNAKGAAAGVGMASAIEGFLKDQNK